MNSGSGDNGERGRGGGSPPLPLFIDHPRTAVRCAIGRRRYRLRPSARRGCADARAWGVCRVVSARGRSVCGCLGQVGVGSTPQTAPLPSRASVGSTQRLAPRPGRVRPRDRCNGGLLATLLALDAVAAHHREALGSAKHTEMVTLSLAGLPVAHVCHMRGR